MTAILVILVLIAVGVFIFLKKRKKVGFEVKEKILEFYKLLPELEKGNPKTKKGALQILKNLKKSFMDFSIEVKNKTGNQIFGRQEIESLSELINKYQNADINDKRIIRAINSSVKKIEDLFSQGLLALYKKMTTDQIIKNQKKK
ncbi:MAG: hypothetical protein PHZ26_01705 [Candidatus Gracilibacteria bacterium]|nr:hypothetical protein [Candidatus Gracilibacteria bacterium]MDD2908449.1 hypothetical protein [Candidatus Gracilibacteria bacterium]